MVTAFLVDRDFSGSERLLAELEREGLPIAAAFWRFPTSGSDWRLVIASPLVDREGSLPVYRRIQAALGRVPGVHLGPSEVVAIGDQDPVLGLLRRSVPADAVPGSVAISLPLSFPVSYAPYVPDEATGITVYVQRLAPEAGADGAASAAPTGRWLREPPA